MIEIGSRRRAQPPPPQVVFDSLTVLDPEPDRPWLYLLPDEQRPRVIRSEPAQLVVWSSIWSRRPDARIRFDLEPDGAGTALRWTLLVDEPLPDESLTGHLRTRLNRLINADLRYSYGQ